MKTDRLLFLQWTASQGGNGQWTFNTTDGTRDVHLGYQGLTSAGTPIVGVDHPMPFDVWPAQDGTVT